MSQCRGEMMKVGRRSMSRPTSAQGFETSRRDFRDGRLQFLNIMSFISSGRRTSDCFVLLSLLWLVK